MLNDKFCTALKITFVRTLRQPRNAWSLEVELRPWVETIPVGHKTGEKG